MWACHYAVSALFSKSPSNGPSFDDDACSNLKVKRPNAVPSSIRTDRFGDVFDAL